ncbi:MAG: DUF222 domain-containing protein [Candidatus Dormibacteria bacterium]|jgi:hypothetical protein
MCDGVDDTTAGAAGLAVLEAAVERLELETGPNVSPEALRGQLIRLRHLIDLLELPFASMVISLGMCDEVEWGGYPSPIQWVRHACKTSAWTAVSAFHVGEQSVRLENSTRALRAGEIGYGHLALLAQTADAVTESPTGSGFDEAALLRKARQHTVGRFFGDCAHARHAADQRRFLTEQQDTVDARSLIFTTFRNGCLGLRGFLDSEGGAALRTALEPLAKPNGRDDDRNRERRFADALVELAGHALDSGSLPQRAGQRPHLQVTATLETLQGLEGAPAAELEIGGPIAGETARRLACDAAVSRIVFDAQSAVVDVGRARRLPGSATRRALQARDGGCVWPGCDRPASWSQAHHLQSWAQGGSTDVDNLVLICRAHHWKIHEGGWMLLRGGEGLVTLPPLPDDLGPPLRIGPLAHPRARAPSGADTG